MLCHKACFKLFLIILPLVVSGCSSPSRFNSPESDRSISSPKPMTIDIPPESQAQTQESQAKTEEFTLITPESNPDAVTLISESAESGSMKIVDESITDTESTSTPDLSSAISKQTYNDLWEKMRSDFELVYSNPNDPLIAKFENWYSRHPKYFERLAERAYWYLPYILAQTQARNMPAEVALLPAIESAFRAEAVSRSKAVGMWQFMGSTGTRFGLRRDWWMDGRRDMVLSTRAALDYLEILSGQFNGNWELVFAAYNAGEGTIGRAIKKNQSQGKPATYPNLTLPRETREYVPKLFAVRNIIANPEKFNIRFRSIPIHQTLAVVDAKTQTDLAVAASLIPLDKEQLYKFNRGYSRGVTPPNGPHQIVVPTEYQSQLTMELDKLSLQQRLRWARHQVRKGEYLGRIARQHRVTVDSIMQANRLSSNLIKPGQELKIPISTGFHQYARASVSDVKVKHGDKVYTVRKGDSLWKISQGTGISLASILRWNGISKNTLLYPGQQLIVGKSS